ncbi:TNT domain-containing protein [Cellulomonas sp. NPDC089187]|uniref:TNT domain-containing protein n=1 Tax=Cellulomonas sp. NPDC089187 TaxID=3154970 RepID=UPI00344A0B4E
MSANPLVADAVDTSTAFGGAGLLDSIESLTTSIKNEDWLATGLSTLAVGLDVAATVSDPLGSLIGAGLGWLMEHLEPLKGWLNDLTGDAGQVLGYAGTWTNVAGALTAAGDELDRVVTADLEGMSGEAVTRYASTAHALADRIRAAGESADAVASALNTCSTIVQIVHDVVRDALASIVGSLISYAVELVFTLGLATPLVVEQAATRVAALASRVGKNVTDVVTSARSLRELVDGLKGVLDELAGALRLRPRGADAPSATPATRHPSGLRVTDETPSNPWDQIIDPRIHRDNYSITEPDYDPFGGLSRDDFIDQYHSQYDPQPGTTRWDWPGFDGAVPGTNRTVDPTEMPPLDRVGGAGGEYFAPLDTPFGQRSLPPDRLSSPRSQWTIDQTHPLLSDGTVHIESSTVAPYFGQSGGGTQYRFLIVEEVNGSPVERALAQWELEAEHIIVEMKGS